MCLCWVTCKACRSFTMWSPGRVLLRLLLLAAKWQQPSHPGRGRSCSRLPLRRALQIPQILSLPLTTHPMKARDGMSWKPPTLAIRPPARNNLLDVVEQDQPQAGSQELADDTAIIP